MNSRYRVDYTNRADEDIEGLGFSSCRQVLRWIDKNLNGCESPEAFGHPLTDEQSHAVLVSQGILSRNSKAWCYRIGEYRLLAEIRSDLYQILVVGLRRDSVADGNYEPDDAC